MNDTDLQKAELPIECHESRYALVSRYLDLFPDGDGSLLESLVLNRLDKFGFSYVEFLSDSLGREFPEVRVSLSQMRHCLEDLIDTDPEFDGRILNISHTHGLPSQWVFEFDRRRLSSNRELRSFLAMHSL